MISNIFKKLRKINFFISWIYLPPKKVLKYLHVTRISLQKCIIVYEYITSKYQFFLWSSKYKNKISYSVTDLLPNLESATCVQLAFDILNPQ